MESPSHPDQTNELFTFRDIEGNQGFEAIKAVGKFFDILKMKIPEVKAVALIGSTVKGYATDKSDIDISIILEASKEESDGIMADISKEAGEFNMRLINDRETRHFDDRDLKHVMHVLDFANMAEVKEHDIINDPAKIIALLYPALGDVKLIESYRKRIQRAVGTLSEREKQRWLEHIMSYIQENEYSVVKEMSRKNLIIGEIDSNPFPVDEFREKHLELFRKRIEELFIEKSND